ncbi:MAG TPA: SRPBCC family protein [Pseudonocardia sp.]|jgi:hypothetical protein|nr:SRPBCC family protein [Pseudonocardia sp.]
MTDLTHSESVVVAASPESLYDLVSDVTRVGEWSPECREAWWDEGATAKVGDWFTGRNESGEQKWETKSQVVAADRGKEFAFAVGGSYVRWGYTFAPVDGGTELTESWEFLPDGIAYFKENFGAEADAAIEGRVATARSGIHDTLSAIKKIAESG